MTASLKTPWPSWLQEQGFRFRSGGTVSDCAQRFEEWDFVQGPLLQRMVVYVQSSGEFVRAVLRTKCVPVKGALALYDVEALSIEAPAHPQDLEPWLASQRQQLAVSGPESFFSDPATATPYSNCRQPQLVRPVLNATA